MPDNRVLTGIQVYSSGLCYLSACMPEDMPVAEAETRVNLTHPTGIASQWCASGEAFTNGQPSPHPCEHDPARVHRLFSC